MRIGQIVSIEDNNNPQAQTGIILRREKEDQGMFWWYEVLANDEKTYVLPEFLLSPRLRQIRGCEAAKKYQQKSAKSQQHGTNTSHNELHYIHNGKQKLK